MKIIELITFIKRFCYYGYHGARYTRDYDAQGIHHLIYAHIRRVKRFMHNPKLTHLQWNSDPQNRDMRLLREFEELSKRMSEDSVGHFLSEVCKEYGPWDGMSLKGMNDLGFKKKIRIAIKKDSMKKKGEIERYYYLLEHKVPHFWD